MIDPDLQHKLSKARANLVLNHPFLGTIALQKLNFKIVDESWFQQRGIHPTAAVSPTEACFCDTFIDGLSDDEVTFLVAHECMHPVFEHHWRRKERDPKLWNVAGDIIINELLTTDGVGKMPEGGVRDKEMYNEADGVSEAVYDLLEQQQDQSGSGAGSGDGGSDGDGGQPLFDTLMEDNATPAEQEQAAQEWKIAVAQAAQTAKMMGKMSAGMQRIVDDMLEPKVDWREVLMRFLVKCRSTDRSFARPNRRLVSQGIYMPSVTGEQLGELVFAIDCSGSVSDNELAQYAAEIRRVKEDLRPSKIHVVYFDSSVCHMDTFERDDELEVNPHGGGGTAYSPVFEHIQEQGIETEAVIFLTDLCCSDYGEQPDCPVLWVCNQENYREPPFGEVVKM